MRELTGYEDKYGRPILEGDIITWRAASEIHLVEEVSEGWFPMSFCDDAEVAALEIIGSAYTEQGRQLLAAYGIPWSEKEEGQGADYV
jgi:hypothetical protein